MTTRLQTLFSLEVGHDYYRGPCPDIGFLVPENAARLLRDAGMMAKTASGAIVVRYLASEAGAPVRSATGKTLRIGLVVRDPSFANITEGFDPGSGALYYRNARAAGALDDPPAKVALRDLDRELWRRGAFGVVDVAIAAALYASPASYRIRFQARADTLRYYVVVKGFSNGDVDQLAVQEQAPNSPGRPDEVRFEKVPPAQLTADERSRTEILGSDGAKVLLFRSATSVARRERSARQIQLMRNTEPVIERLPQPGKDRGTADLIVHLSKSKS
jgi:hypothetical protein